jgi:outer membrane lipoprotein SlyB
MPRRVTYINGAALAAALAACTAAPPARLAERHEGVVEALRPAGRGDPASLAEDGAGAFLGGIAGALVGSLFGDGAGRAAATGLGFVAGIVGGRLAENALEAAGPVLAEIRLASGEVVLLRLAARGDLAPGRAVVLRYLTDGRVIVETV